MASKRPRTSPVKGTDKCAACAESLIEESSAMQCDICDKWLCITCLDLTEPEYTLLTKMTRRMGCEWQCVVCKVNGTATPTAGTTAAGATAAEVSSIVTASLAAFRQELNKDFATADDIDKSVKKAMKNSLADLKRDLKQDFDQKFQDIESRVATVELNAGVAVNQAAVQIVMAAEIAKLQQDFNKQLDTKVKSLISEDRDKQRRKLNIITFGVPQQPDDAKFIGNHLAKDYALPNVRISDVRRLIPTTQQNQQSHGANAQNPPPILFSVPNLKIKKDILQKSYEKKATATVQFRNDVSKEERAKRQALYAELYKRRDAGEKDIVIRGNIIVSKNQNLPASPVSLGNLMES